MSFWVKGLAIVVVRAVSAFFRCLGWRACRFHPSCSCYSEEAIRRFGIFEGLRLATLRFLKCNPFHAGGHDPLPVDTAS